MSAEAVQVSPDGLRYLAASEIRLPYPFHLRWPLPFLLRDNTRAWMVVNRAAVIGVGALTAIYAGSPWMACVVFLPALAFSWKFTILVDAPAMLLALGAALIWSYSPIAAVAFVLIAGCTRETSPIWAAVYAWNPILLIGLLPVALRTLKKAGRDIFDGEHEWIVQHPISASLKYHRNKWRDPFIMLTPWGGMAVGVMNMDPQLAIALLVGYAQLLVATDSARLYQWAAPVLALACVQGLPAEVLPFIALSVVFNPFTGDGS